MELGRLGSNGKGKTYFPIAKDRDQAFYINQGILPGFVKGRALVPQLEGFKPKAKSISRFNFAARNLDRFFLNQLTEQDWKNEAEQFLAKMTDAVIDRAIAQQPREIRDISAERLRNFEGPPQFHSGRSNGVLLLSCHKRSASRAATKKNNTTSPGMMMDGHLVEVFKITNEGNHSTKMYERKFIPH